ncbi:MAG: hypothetical protein VYE77_00510 [Planctomycetota bacterium]|nr:hypothetical protein [Planctomycetota bacterium]
MGWLRTMFLGDVGNRLDIADNENRIAQMQEDQRRRNSARATKDQSQDEAIAALRGEVDQLEVALGTLATLLVSKGVVTEAEMGRFIDAIESGDDASS